MTPTLKLPFTFDAERVKAELENFTKEDWTPHFNTQYYEGDWSGIALRAAENAHVALYPDPTAETYIDTDAMSLCPSVASILATFECPTESVRFLRLGAGASILEHRDYLLSIEDGVARIHIPIKTSTAVEFYLDGKRIEMNEGEAWYLNFNLKHSVENKSSAERIHLVIDCIANDWLRSFFDQE
jgi:hypothetical protein